jgi:hypothetical protein
MDRGGREVTGTDFFPKWFVVLNSAVGIWFLSTVAVGGISAYYAHFQQCVHDADQKRDEFYKLVHELKTRRRLLASKLQGRTNATVLELAEPPDPGYASTSYIAVYWKLREIIDNIKLPESYKLVPFVKSFHGDFYWKLISGEETVQSIGLNKLTDFSKAVVANDAHEVRLPGPLKRRCGPFEVVPSIFGFARPTLYAEEGREVEQPAHSLIVADGSHHPGTHRPSAR